ACAWRTVGRAGDRQRQIIWMLELGAALRRYTGNPLLRQSLRLMRGPARAAGFTLLHGFLEKGLETFRAMGSQADAFLATIAERERRLAAALFAGDRTTAEASGQRS